MRFYLNNIVVMGLVIFFNLTGVLLAQYDTVTTASRWHDNKVSVASMEKRISDAAEEYKEYAPIPRIAFYDIGYPQSKEEFLELKGYGLVLVSALSQNEIELPLKRVYAVIDGKEIELELLKEVLSKETNTATRTFQTFGAFKVDSLYLFPVYLRKQNATLLIDFAKNREGMKLAALTGEMSSIVKSLPETLPTGKAELTDAMKNFMRREYPGFFEK